MCVIDTTGEARFTVFKGLLQFIGWALHEAPSEAVVTVENSNLTNATFDMSGDKKEVARKSRNVGANQAASQYTYDVCKFVFGSNAHEVSPLQKGAKRDDKTVRYLAKANGHQLTNYKGIDSEQDKRDAYCLALISKDKHRYQKQTKSYTTS